MNRFVQQVKSNPVWLELESRYALLADNDRRALQGLMVALMVAGLYFLIWQPLDSWVTNEKDEFIRQESVYQWMKQNLGEAVALQKKQKLATDRKDLSAIVSGTARQVGITISRVQPDKKGLGIWIEDVAYQKLLKWLLVLENQYHLSIHQVRMNRLKDEGRVKVFIHLAN